MYIINEIATQSSKRRYGKSLGCGDYLLVMKMLGVNNNNVNSS